MSDVETPTEQEINKEQKISEEQSQEVVQEEAEDNVVELKDSAAAEDSEEEKFKQKFYYVAAELENANKRFAREKENLIKYGNEKIISSLVEVVDNLERTLDALTEDSDDKTKNIVSGIEMVQKQFLDILERQGLKQVEAIGKSFDPNFHEAISQQNAEGKEDGEIITEYQKGYTLNSRLLRASKVVIVKN